MIRERIKQEIKQVIRRAGLEVHRVAYNQDYYKNKKDLPPIYDDPLAALGFEQSGETAAFKCPLNLTVKPNGLSYGSDKWHPFVETLREYGKGEITTYEGSVLEAYYATHQPANASEGIIGFKQTPDFFRSKAAHIYRHSPWRSLTPTEIDAEIKRFTKQHSLSHGNQFMTLNSDGFQYHGPVSLRKGRLEYQRLIRTYNSVKDNGYDRRQGHAQFFILRRENEIRYLALGSGNHRTATMAALGYKTIPAIFQRPSFIDLDMAQYWPQVQRNLWSVDQAVAYFNHLFDFDSKTWARGAGLLKN